MESLSPRRGRVRAFIDEVLLYRATPPEEEALITEQARRETARVVKPLLLAACFVGLLWWPLDFVLYAGHPGILRAFSLWRATMVVYCLVYYFTIDRWALLRRYHAAWGTLLGGSMTFVIAASVGSLGSLDQPWFPSLYFAPIMSFPFLLRFEERAVGVSAVGLAAFAGFYGVSPGNFQHPNVGTTFGLMTFAVAFATFGGHGVYHLFRQNFLQSLTLAERTRQLEDLSRTLSERVEARTAELKLLATHVQELRETDSRAIAHELHDELGQLLTGMRVELEIAERVRERGGDVASHHMTLVELLDATLLSTRSILAGLQPRILDDLGLVAALEWLASDARRRSQVDVRLEVRPEDLTVPRDMARALFRIVQESLTNALRHARAQQIRIGLTLDEIGLTATVEDDGVGLPPPEVRRPHSLGLISMRERASAVGGSFSLDAPPPPATGTLVTVRVPRATILSASGEAA